MNQRRGLFGKSRDILIRALCLSCPGKPGGNRVFPAVFALLLMIPSVMFWPVDTLVIRDARGNVVLSARMPLGRSFETQYLHSVQLTPVEDLYFVRDGLIRQWQTRIQSQNAGLTSVALPESRFRLEQPWMIFEGALLSLSDFALRVGNTVIGQNYLRIGNGKWMPLFQAFSGERLYLETERKALYASREEVTRGGLNLQ